MGLRDNNYSRLCRLLGDATEDNDEQLRSDCAGIRRRRKVQNHIGDAADALQRRALIQITNYRDDIKRA